jgi:hypothetical protein
VKRLNPDEEIQTFPLIVFGLALLDLARFGGIWIRLGFSLEARTGLRARRARA